MRVAHPAPQSEDLSPPSLSDRLNDVLDIVKEIQADLNSQMEGGSAFRFLDRRFERNLTVVRSTKPPLPHPDLLRQIIRERRRRDRYFVGALFADPAWDMLLDLALAKVEQKRVSVTSLCIASAVPATTALRWIAMMTKAGIFERVKDDMDSRRSFVCLTDEAAAAIARYFADLPTPAFRVI